MRQTPSRSDATAKAAPVLVGLLLLASALGSAQPSAVLPWTTFVIDSAVARPAKMFEAFNTPRLNLYDPTATGNSRLSATTTTTTPTSWSAGAAPPWPRS